MEDILKWRIQDGRCWFPFLAISLLLLLKIVYVLANFLDFIRDLTFLMSTLINGNLDSANKFNNMTSEQC